MTLGYSWSFSTLKNFESCPHKYFRTKVQRDVIETYGDAQSWGNRVHDSMCKRINAGIPLSQETKYLEPWAAKIESLPGDKYPEIKFAIDDAFKATNWKGAWSRGAADLLIVSGRTGALFDYKTGSRRPDEQLHLYAGYTFAHFPEIEKVHMTFMWLKDKKTDKDSIERDQIGPVWKAFTQRIHRLEIAHEKNEWKKTPSGLCRKHCPVKDCEFNGED